MMESIGPELGIEVGTFEQSTHGVSYTSVTSFNGSVLVRCIGSSGLDLVSELLEELVDLGVPIQLASLVHIDILAWTSW